MYVPPVFRRIHATLLFALAALCLPLAAVPALAQAPGKQWVEAATKATPVVGQKRLALILGNTHYGGEHELKNPENDAKDIAKVLGGLGFTSTVVLDGSLDQMSDALHAFAEQVRSAGPSSVALLYYSGHGIQVNGENYLLPVGFKMPTYEWDMIRHAVSAQAAVDEMQAAGAQVNVAILDACRNNPFAKDRAFGGKGLAKLEAQGVMVAYATAAGATASDNTGERNGLYTKSLLQFLRKPGLSLSTVFSQTRKAVYTASGKKQLPYVYDGLIDADEFYLLPGKKEADAPAVEMANVNKLDTKARLTITTNVPGATILVDDKPVPDGTFSLNLGISKEKTVEVGIAADGYEPAVQTVRLTRGKMVMLPVVLAVSSVLPTPAPVVPAPSSRFTPPLTLAQYKAQMVTVPAGAFTMGSDTSGEKDEKPAHKVYLSAYNIGKTAVTVGMWEEFCKATDHAMPEEPDFNRGWSKRGHPVVNVSWDDAQEYCRWAGLKLPSEAQWEKAARGTDGREYPWGKDFDTTKLWCSTAKPGDAGGTHVVGDFPSGASPYGCLDMAGNVWQWCEDRYDETFYASRRATEADIVNESGKDGRVVRGASWFANGADIFRSAIRDRFVPAGRYDFSGFRAVSRDYP